MSRPLLSLLRQCRPVLVSFFALALATNLILGSGGLQAQTAPPKTPDELKARIEARAQNHAYAGEFMYQDEVYEEFKDNSFDWNRSQILDVYETAFIAEQDRLGTEPERSLPLSWITAGCLFILLIFRDALQEKLGGVAAGLLDWSYQLIAGNRVFRNLALRKYRTALRDKLQTLDTPFKIEPPLPMKEVYVPLKVREWADNTVTQANTLDIYQAIIQQQRLMVTGPPGSGKSVLLKHIAFTYGQGELDLPDNPIPIRLELNTLVDPSLNAEALVQRLVEVLASHNFPKADNFVEKGLDTGKLLLLFDGLDEVGSAQRPVVVRAINQLLEGCDCPAVVTCRTAVYNHEFDVALDRNLLEVDEFSDQQILRFLQAWSARMPADKSVEQLMQTLQDRPNIKALARNPLLLTIIAYLYTETQFILPHSRAEFYEKATNILLELRDQERNIRNEYSSVAKRQVLRKLALFAQESIDVSNPDRRSIPRARVLQLIDGILPDIRVKPGSAEPILNEIVNRSGLFLKLDSGEDYQFAHLTLQEFFAAGALVSNAPELIRQFQADPKAWREVVKLWCGLASNSTTLIDEVRTLDLLTAFECLADAQEVDQNLAAQIVDMMMQSLPLAAADDEIAKAFGTALAQLKA